MAIRRYKYRMHHSWLTGLRLGKVTPVFLQEVTPGDTWSGVSNALFRLAPMDYPAFTALSVHIHFFFVAHRNSWSDFEDVVTGVASSAWPTITLPTTFTNNEDLAKAYGLVGNGTTTYAVNALPFRAYNDTYNNFFRDQQISTTVGTDNTALKKAFYGQNDYFGGARSEIQQGTEETVDTSGGTLSVTALRDAQHRQRFRERRSQFGERYTDYLAAMGLRVPDSRLDRPEHVARARGVIGISEVVATATSASENTGRFRGHGIAGIRLNFRPRMFYEHGTLLGVAFIRPRLQIRDRIDRIFFTGSKDDLYQPELARDTQVAIRTGELNVSSPDLQAVWGYTARDEWLRSPRDVVGGEMNDVAQESWSSSRVFTTDPTIQDVIRCDEHKELFQDQTATAVQCYAYFDHYIGKRSVIPRRRSLA